MLRLIPVFAATVFLSLNFGALLYVNSTFLGNFFGPAVVSLIFLAASAINILLFIAAPRLLNFFGKETLLFLFLLVTALGAFGLTISVGGAAAAIAFTIYESFIFMAYYCLDIFVEEKTLNAHTGEIRGVYYTLLNAGIVLGPLFLTFLTEKESLDSIYLAALLFLTIPLLLSMFWALKKDKEKSLHAPINLPLKQWWRKRNIRAVSLCKLALEIFFGVMVIYTPLYLHGKLGFEWAELGIIFAVMLLPFVFLEWPAGELADRYIGEKEMMSFGFFLMGSMLLLMPYIPKVFLLWLVALLVSRVGASLVEITTESYFFKKISAADTGILAIFRILRPAGILSGALLGIIISAGAFSIEKIFFALALIVFWGMYEALHLRDTL
jgi:MFS family permease